MQFGQLKRREFMSLFGGAAAWPLAARAQQAVRMRRIVFLHAIAEDDPEAGARVAAFRQGLATLGWMENSSVQIEHRFASGDFSRIRALATDLASSAPDLIVASSAPVVAALKEATRSIPIVFCLIIDPVGMGLVASLARPGGNITGFTSFEFPIIGKWLETLKEIDPGIRRIAFLFNPETAPYYPDLLRQFGSAAASLATELSVTPVRNDADIEAAATALAREPGAALIAAPEPFTVTRRDLIMALAQRYRLPALYGLRPFVTEGGLISYGPDPADIVRRSASYVGRILKGENPADLPVQAPVKYELVINLKTAKALGLEVPPTLLARADEVIE